ncbi:hypothetical protein G7K_2626-t1 [Saitoella complicata NRRL Y-17804]|uniref:Uncharacterized protein n=1 Tax=Saitoella complicata (strain BCRC 22490 / CBS 7301 / JCM 7358 / NBRC 10748 / NRRL Y-17804) TaxID=698492 RepID=A0A0E9NF68_SAICN|nr:hypothetical protein G7K_2626-t1 [Saitoella complicata NRRL Y-17804]
MVMGTCEENPITIKVGYNCSAPRLLSQVQSHLQSFAALSTFILLDPTVLPTLLPFASSATNLYRFRLLSVVVSSALNRRAAFFDAYLQWTVLPHQQCLHISCILFLDSSNPILTQLSNAPPNQPPSPHPQAPTPPHTTPE